MGGRCVVAFCLDAMLAAYPRSVLARPSRTDAFEARRAEGAVAGGFVADAASMPVHWIYDQEEVQRLVDVDGEDVAFLKECYCPFYKHPTGRLSVYGEELWPLLESIADEDGFEVSKFRAKFYDWASKYDSRLNHIANVFVEKWESGQRTRTADDNDMQAHAITKAVVLAARYSAKHGLFTHLDSAVAVHQGSSTARAAGRAAAALLRAVIEGQPLWAAVEIVTAQKEDVPEEGRAMLARALQVANELRAHGLMGSPCSWETHAADCDKKPVLLSKFLAAVRGEGLSCQLPGALVNAVTAALVFNGYKEAVSANLLAAGDGCSRAILVGALSAAASVTEYGEVLTFIPRKWQQKTLKLQQIRNLAQQLRQDVGGREL